jgi:hypothetical protein
MDPNQWKPDEVVDPKKKNNAWDSVKDLLSTNESHEAMFDGELLVADGLPCRSPTVPNAKIS